MATPMTTLSSIPSGLEQKAFEFANFYHTLSGAKRKYTDEPYIVHPARVAMIVRGIGGGEYERALAWLHDVVDDTPATLEEIKERFGDGIAEGVEYLSDHPSGDNVTRFERKQHDRNRLAAAPPNIKTVKLADTIANTEGRDHALPTTQHYIQYMLEKLEMLKALRGGNLELWVMARYHIEHYLESNNVDYEPVRQHVESE